MVIDKRDNRVSIKTECDCTAEILCITYYEIDNDEPRVYFLTIYRSARGHSFWWKLKEAWRYLKWGEFHGNGVVLDANEYDEFIKALMKAKGDNNK